MNDLRIKMCIDPTEEDFTTIHHELGHNFYQRAYNGLSYLHQNSANDGFHEAVGDAIALSVTPSYLVRVGLIGSEPPASKDLGLLMRDALAKVAFLPFGLLVDQWRWRVFAGDITPAAYNAGYVAADRWLREAAGVPLDEWIERIPYRETRRYTRRVLQTYGIYAFLDTGKLPPLPATLPAAP